jgi:hypothetical protein
MDWSKIGELAKLPTKVYAIIALTTGAALFLPKPVLERLNLDAIPAPWGTVLGIVFLVSAAMVIANTTGWLMRKRQASQRAAARTVRVMEKLANLDGEERAILREFIVLGRSTLRLPMDNPTVAGLIASSVIQQTGSYGKQTIYGMLFPYQLSDDTQMLLMDEILGIPDHLMPPDGDGKKSLTQQGACWVHDNRPAFIHDIERFEAPVHRRW